MPSTDRTRSGEWISLKIKANQSEIHSSTIWSASVLQPQGPGIQQVIQHAKDAFIQQLARRQSPGKEMRPSGEQLAQHTCTPPPGPATRVFCGSVGRIEY